MHLAAQLLFSRSVSNKSPKKISSEDEEYDPFWRSSENGGQQVHQCPSAGSDSCHQGDGQIGNGCPLLQPRAINPERLKDFGEDEFLEKDVKTCEVTVTGRTETQLSNTLNMTEHKTNQTLGMCSGQIQFEDISVAAFKISNGIQKTPCTYSRLSKQYGMDLYLKKEYLHYTGTVKERGVWYLLTSLSKEQQRKGVILASDNNFSKAMAHHATELHIPIFIIVPTNTSPDKVKTCREYGAMVITYGSTVQDSRSHAKKLATENGYLYLQEEDSAPYLAGLGTMGLEVYEQVNKLDAVILPAGGECNLLAGAAAPIKHLNPGITVIGVEPENYPTLQQSLELGQPPADLACTSHRLYGELVNASFGSNAFQITKKLIDKVVTVKVEDILLAILRLIEYEKAIVDAEGAIGLAAVVAGKLPELKGKRVVIALCSGNIDIPLLHQCLDRALVVDNRLCKFSIQLTDCAGDLAKLLEILAREEVQVLNITQERAFITSDIFTVKVTCVIKVRDRMQGAQLQRTLSDRYATFTWLDQ
ncbi:L-threonine ammonia-lyase isoform X1 [Chiloscyllium plagiosum]|uniref:L-threonine ammonia-lyase isoform X1 n=1 Tax=Chiloscyllium plagiosum TaxID=36176 RepID=UPI001CB7F5E4|nr:L-threonine ammonia-lyase isoform X1 [Chiloscyllium plagiosum]XP_043534663.1 L-threonine ammonia-lyase isoform X1 [Chiloscyllium plagiosum]XP_043534664.1 L-threonine ammonia-lyase isoform X1 [Chiloscyllium plagiosum]